MQEEILSPPSRDSEVAYRTSGEKTRGLLGSTTPQVVIKKADKTAFIDQTRTTL